MEATAHSGNYKCSTPATAMSAMLRLEGVSVCYGRAQVLFGVDLAVEAGEAVVLLGRNGAGKSTTLRAILGLVPVSAGRVAFGGRNVTGLPTHVVARLGLGYVPEDRRVFADLTVAENLEVGRQAPRAGVPAWSRDGVLALFPALAPLLHRRGGSLSGGEQQMLVVARTLLGNPRLLLLDEPSEGLAPLVVEQLVAAIARIKAEGVAILMSEQNLAAAEAVADRAYVLERGRVAYDGTMAALAADEAARQAWLGLG